MLERIGSPRVLAVYSILLIMLGTICGIVLHAFTKFLSPIYDHGLYESASPIDFLIVVVSIGGNIILVILMRLFITHDLRNRFVLEDYLSSEMKIKKEILEFEIFLSELSPTTGNKLVRDEGLRLNRIEELGLLLLINKGKGDEIFTQSISDIRNILESNSGANIYDHQHRLGQNMLTVIGELSLGH